MADQDRHGPDEGGDGAYGGRSFDPDTERRVKEERSRSRSRRGRRGRDRDEDDEDRYRERRSRDRDRRRSRRRGSRGRDSSGDSAPRPARKKRQLPGLWDSTVPVQNQQVVESMLMGDPKTRELYIGHLAPGCNPKMLEDLFNSLFQALPEYKRKYGEQPPVCKAQMYGNGTFAFVEFRSKEVAQTATKFDQCVLMNHPIHIGRPQGYIPPPPGQDPAVLDVTPLLRSGLIPATPMTAPAGPPMLMNGPPGGPLAIGAPPGMTGGPPMQGGQRQMGGVGGGTSAKPPMGMGGNSNMPPMSPFSGGPPPMMGRGGPGAFGGGVGMNNRPPQFR